MIFFWVRWRDDGFIKIVRLKDKTLSNKISTLHSVGRARPAPDETHGCFRLFGHHARPDDRSGAVGEVAADGGLVPAGRFGGEPVGAAGGRAVCRAEARRNASTSARSYTTCTKPRDVSPSATGSRYSSTGRAAARSRKGIPIASGSEAARTRPFSST